MLRAFRMLAQLSATASAIGFAPCGPPWWRRTLTAPASMSRPPMTSIVWTRNCSALAIFAPRSRLIGVERRGAEIRGREPCRAARVGAGLKVPARIVILNSWALHPVSIELLLGRLLLRERCCIRCCWRLAGRWWVAPRFTRVMKPAPHFINANFTRKRRAFASRFRYQRARRLQTFSTANSTTKASSLSG